MSVVAASRTESTAIRWSPQWITDRISGVVLNIAVIGLTVAWVVPTAGLLVTSFRTPSDIANTGWWTALSPPFKFTLDNYSQMLAASNLGTGFFNSIMISIPAVIIPITVAAFAAYAFSWMRFPGRDWIFLALVGLLAVPLQLTFIPVLSAFNKLGITPDHLTLMGLPPDLGLWLAHAGYGLPFSIYLLSNLFRALPSDLFESAEIDGAGTLTVFFRIVMPLSVPAIASWHLPVPVGLERPAGRPHVRRGPGKRGADDGLPRGTGGLIRPELSALDGSRVLLDDRSPRRLPQPPAILCTRHPRRFCEGIRKKWLQLPTTML
ncbi:MAG: hypothetical protein NVS9B11_20180 [Candidatus Dormibacteraceae bacterium]